MIRPITIYSLLSLAVATAGAAAPAKPAATSVDFAKEIQPIFAERCYECHGEKKQKSSFRLDVMTTAFAGGESGKPAIVAGKSSESGLIRHVTSTDPDEMMPPKGDRLTAVQIATLKKWIDAGANWPEQADSKEAKQKRHWAFKAPVKPAVPAVKNRAWIRNSIDNFILAKLEKEKLSPSPEADKVTLLRRLYLDLIGLPPKPEEVDAFLGDSSKDAYKKVVEELLASAHYGERWGRHWLDAARYADSDGYEKDMSREVWPYRDYVVNAFNHDLPYNQFIIEQIAGDLLPNRTQDQIVATGFLRNSMVNMEGAIDPEQFRMESMFDRMDCIGKAVLGLTIQCAQCHNHKFDPIAQEEYYRIFAFINNDHEGKPLVYTPEQQMKVADLRRKMSEIESDLKHRAPDWEKRMADWEDSVKDNQPEWAIFGDLEQEGDKDQRYEDKKDGSWLACGYAPTKMTQWFRITNHVNGVTAFRLELLTDPNLPYGGPGRAFNGTCALSEFLVEAADVKFPTNKVKVKWKEASADVEQSERPLEPNFYDKSTNSRSTGPIKFAIDGNDKTAWGINVGPGRRNQDRKAVFVCEKPVALTNDIFWRIGLRQNHGGWNSDDHMNNNLGRFRVSATTASGSIKADPLPKKVRDIFKIPREKRTSVQVATVFSYWRTIVSDWRGECKNRRALERVSRRRDFSNPARPRTAARNPFASTR